MVRLSETESERLYRRVEVEPIDEAAAPDLEADRLRPPLIDAIHDRTGVEVESLEDVATGQLGCFMSGPISTTAASTAWRLIWAPRPSPHICATCKPAQSRPHPVS